MISHANEKLRRDLDDSEQTRARLDLTVSQFRATNRDLISKLKVEKDEVCTLGTSMCLKFTLKANRYDLSSFCSVTGVEAHL